MAILHPRTQQEKMQATREAAQAPALFAELLTTYPGRLPTDDNLRAYLIRENFAPSALPAVIQSLRDTMELAFPGGNVENPAVPESQMREESVSHTSATAHGGGSGRLEASTIRHGVSRATLPLTEGVAAVEFPDRLSPESYEDLKDWMEGMLRRAERVMKRTQQDTEIVPSGGEPN